MGYFRLCFLMAAMALLHKQFLYMIFSDGSLSKPFLTSPRSTIANITSRKNIFKDGSTK
jgi:hypothetical protein